MGFDWREINERTKNARLEHSNESDDNFLNFVEEYFHPCYEQLSVYANEMMRNKNESKLSSDAIKEMVLHTRAALRFGLLCISKDDKCNLYSEEAVATIQSKAIVTYHWHDPLATILSRPRGDKKSRILAAQLMSNLVTSNARTASIISTNVGLSPSPESVSSSILDTIPDREDFIPSSSSVKVIKSNWVDMFISAAKSRNRDAIAAVAAFLHNCIASLLQDQDELEHRKRNLQFVRDVASNGMLVSTILRHFVSAEAIIEALDKEKEGSKEQADYWDSATEWIQLLLSKLAKLGMLSSMFSSISTTCGEKNALVRLLPEQNVLLQCISRDADAYVMEFGSNRSVEHPFGGEVRAMNENYLFLASLAVDISPWFRRKRLPTTQTNDQLDAFNDQLLLSGFLTVNEILASTLGVEGSVNESLRLYLGHETAILQESAKSLGVVLDDLAEKSDGRKASDVNLSSDDQRLLIGLVKFVGNLCYKCKHNQDLLRTTLVPPAKKSVHRVEVVGEEENDTRSSEMRNGVHVLLSCTTHATSCFTLREWGVIAIRNVLEDNPNNQAIVEELMAQGPVESADLEQAGVRVQLDSKGKVSLSTINET
eukprot:CAMPEP_0172364764 /NCGR_PEP_ID=MMETSP1060-20121228/7819_1 /TAXON_ID=37318 /ORGANISM="Pseudo-nitzschia pungens, Strain cf. cingulata" /LENGTH=597 /DNA_ID=CAMNT_0013087841 /DNA_START=41 /DNA_END=1834 /DNA_ORIENTATION=+